MDEMKLTKYYTKSGGKTTLKPQSLGLTSAQDSLRVYHQVLTWK